MFDVCGVIKRGTHSLLIRVLAKLSYAHAARC